MAKMTIVDDDGSTYTFDHFIAVGFNENNQLMRMAEDEGLSPQEQLGLMMEVAKLAGEMAQAIQPDREQERP